ncbi:MAG: twin-arginine translocase subunit TatC [Candidatus Eremiobacteraeota bacterium]|nr:twin-arginine translocase subunit TatC [Candidatus Eremiobacteraeota bacterium]
MLLERPESAGDANLEWDQKEMTFTEHLRELRNRLMICVATIAAIGVGMFYPSIFVIQWMSREYFPGIKLHAFGPADAVGTMFRFSIYSAIVIGLPVILYQLWMFVVPAIHPKTRRIVYRLLAPSVLLAAVGIVFCHYIVIPVVIRGTTYLTGLIATETYGIGSTLNFLLILFLAFALIFQLPMVLIMLARIGLVSSKSLRTYRRYAIMASLLIGGVAAPDGQPTTMMLMAAPLFLLYEASIWVILLLERSWQRESSPA